MSSIEIQNFPSLAEIEIHRIIKLNHYFGLILMQLATKRLSVCQTQSPSIGIPPSYNAKLSKPEQSQVANVCRQVSLASCGGGDGALQKQSGAPSF